ncbi:MAG: PBP1A family penicillin-binding protein [Bdellovibrionales bacterium]|nr:PBP1A family penicillin-binding protein [Bdellovibrionales bacterium]
MLKKIFITIVFLFFLGFVCVAGFIFWGYQYVTRDLPRLSRIEDYRPPAVTQVLSSNGTTIAEFFEERRYPAKLKEIPIYVRNAFLAAEDASFYSHPGIDVFSIFRAFVKNLQQGGMRQGGSTITQQVVKNLLLSSEKKLERKIKEAILSYKLEQRLSKDDILEMYLNQIYFGNGAYGIKAAARLYFKKELADLSIAQAAMLAGLPKAPSKYSPTKNYERARERQLYVLAQMEKAKFISSKVRQDAIEEELKIYKSSTRTIFAAPYYVTEVRRIFLEKWKDFDIDSDGLTIETALDLNAYNAAQSSVRKGLQEVDKRRGWRGVINKDAKFTIENYKEKYGDNLNEILIANRPYPALVEKKSAQGLTVKLGELTGFVKLSNADWAKKKLKADDSVAWIKPIEEINAGDIIEVSSKKNLNQSEANKEQVELELDQTPEVESALVLIDPLTGKVPVIVGGYSYDRSQFNRATQSFRQPGSSFKPVVYLAAIDGFGYTPATIVYDDPRSFRVGNDYWAPDNFDEKFLGPITLRTALEKSRNLVSADIISRIGVDAAIQYARKLGIKSRLGRNLSLSLGSSEVTPLEITRAYSPFAAKGVLFDSIFITRITDRNGKVIFDYLDNQLTKATQVIDENSAFIMANMMKGVVERGTGWKVRSIGRPVAAKTGTSNDQMDAWFIGYTPNWVCGVWVGFDVKKSIGKKETGGQAAAPIWLDFMQGFLDHEDERKMAQLRNSSKSEAELLGISFQEPVAPKPLDFSVPDGVDPFWIDRYSGTLSKPGEPNAILEYFKKGTEPIKRKEEQLQVDYLESPDL